MSVTSRIKGPLPPLSWTEISHSQLYDRISATVGLAGAAQGLTVLITSANAGIAKATAETFAQAGVEHLILTSLPADLNVLKEDVAASIVSKFPNVKVSCHSCDITKEENVDNVFQLAGPVHCLINSAGFMEPCEKLSDSNPADWFRTIDVNVKGTYLMSRRMIQQAYQHKLFSSQRPISIVTLSSQASTATRMGFSSYGGSKTFLNRMMEFIHYEEPELRTFAIHPGGVRSGLALGSMPQDTHGILVDSPYLAASMMLYLATQREADFLRGKYVSSKWDVDELLRRKTEIQEGQLFVTRAIGQPTIPNP